MKKFVALMMILAMIFVTVGCGIDYEQKGYKYAKDAIAVAEAEDIATSGEDAYRQSMQISVSLLGTDIMITMLTPSIDDLPDDVGYDKMSDENKAEFITGMRKAVTEYVNSFIVQ